MALARAHSKLARIQRVDLYSDGDQQRTAQFMQRYVQALRLALSHVRHACIRPSSAADPTPSELLQSVSALQQLLGPHGSQQLRTLELPACGLDDDSQEEDEEDNDEDTDGDNEEVEQDEDQDGHGPCHRHIDGQEPPLVTACTAFPNLLALFAPCISGVSRMPPMPRLRSLVCRWSNYTRLQRLNWSDVAPLLRQCPSLEALECEHLGGLPRDRPQQVLSTSLRRLGLRGVSLPARQLLALLAALPSLQELAVSGGHLYVNCELPDEGTEALLRGLARLRVVPMEQQQGPLAGAGPDGTCTEWVQLTYLRLTPGLARRLSAGPPLAISTPLVLQIPKPIPEQPDPQLLAGAAAAAQAPDHEWARQLGAGALASTQEVRFDLRWNQAVALLPLWTALLLAMPALRQFVCHCAVYGCGVMTTEQLQALAAALAPHPTLECVQLRDASADTLAACNAAVQRAGGRLVVVG